MHWSAFLAVVLGATSGWLLIMALIPRLSRCMLDQPNHRSSHPKPTPRGGGLAFVVVASVASALSFLVSSNSASGLVPIFSAPLMTSPLAIVGFLDDRHNLPASWRYGVQLATAFILILASPLVSPSFAFLPLLALLMIGVTGLINFTNFMDGLDGLVAGCMAVALTAVTIQLGSPWPMWSMIGALLGFIPWNWSPAKVFMGDVGSTFLGGVFALLVLQAPNWVEAFAFLLVATPLWGDAFLCVLRRLIAGQRVFQAHRLHLFQRLHQAGWPHSRVSSLYISATAVLAVALLSGGFPWVITFAALEFVIGIWLDQQVAVSFVAASRGLSPSVG